MSDSSETPTPPMEVPLTLGDEIMPNSVMPEGVVSATIVFLDADGSRRVLRLGAYSNHLLRQNMERFLANKHIEIPIYWGSGRIEGIRSPLFRGRNYDFLPYPPADGVPIPSQVEPVNPVPIIHGYHKKVDRRQNGKIVYVKGWFEHTSTFAHEIDQLYADHTHQMRQPDSYKTLPDMPHDTESNMRNQNALQVGRGMCGYAFQQTEDFARLPIDGGGTGNVATDWKLHYPKVLEDIQELCVFCEHAFFLRQFLIKHDVVAWRNALDEVLVKRAGDQELRYMRCPKVDKTSEPWMPSTDNFATFSGNAPLRWWKNNMVKWGEAVDYYDAHYGQRPSE